MKKRMKPPLKKLPKKMLPSPLPAPLGFAEANRFLEQEYFPALVKAGAAGSKVKKAVRELERARLDALEKASAAAKRKGRAFSASEADRINRRYRLMYYEVVRRNLPDERLLKIKGWRSVGSSIFVTNENPRLDVVSDPYLYEEKQIELVGAYFGDDEGKVILEYNPNAYMELQVDSWSDSSILATVAHDFSGIRAHVGRVWVVTAEEKTSNEERTLFVPTWSSYSGQYSRSFWFSPFGRSVDETLLKKTFLSDGDFRVSAGTYYMPGGGDGWAESRSPKAYGTSMAHRYHCGIGAGGV